MPSKTSSSLRIGEPGVQSVTVSAADYSSYLHIDELLELQQPLTKGAHDEMLFVVVHQVYELWFKLILHELDRVVLDLSACRPQRAIPPLQRAVRIDELLIHQLRVLETMSPDGFLEFRDPLAPASGLQSGQFRAIEYLGGLREQHRFDESVLSQRDRDDLERRGATPTMYEALCACMRGHGVDTPDGADMPSGERRLAALADLYRNHESPGRALLHQVCELFLDHDEAVARWRFQHVLMASREIGARIGTGGSSGVEYLRGGVNQRFFPELWEVRSRL